MLTTEISKEIPLTNTQEGIIFSLPTIVLAILSGFVDRLNRKVGVVVAIFLALILMLIGFIVRDYLSLVSDHDLALWAIYIGLAIITVGITIMSVLYPAFITTFFNKQLGVMMAINNTNLSLSALAGTFSALILVSFGMDWRLVGTIWFILTLIITLLYIPTLFITKNYTKLAIHEGKYPQAAVAGNQLNSPNMWFQSVGWLIGISLAIESADFYFAITWWKKIAGEAITPEQFTVLVNFFQLICIPASLIAPIIMVRYPKVVPAMTIVNCVLFVMSAIAMLYVTDYTLLLFIFFVFGFTSGALLCIYITLISQKTATPQDTAKLSGMAQAVAFFLTSAFLFGFGALIDLTQSFEIPIWFYIAINITLPFTSVFATIKNIKYQVKNVG